MCGAEPVDSGNGFALLVCIIFNVRVVVVMSKSVL